MMSLCVFQVLTWNLHGFLYINFLFLKPTETEAPNKSVFRFINDGARRLTHRSRATLSLALAVSCLSPLCRSGLFSTKKTGNDIHRHTHRIITDEDDL